MQLLCRRECPVALVFAQVRPVRQIDLAERRIDAALLKCRACGCCVRVCPVGALSFSNESAHADAEKCVLCLRCAAACPFDAVSPPPEAQKKPF